MDLTFSRRAAILGAAAFPVIRVAGAQSRPKTMVISSANRNNGGVTLRQSYGVIRAGGDTLDAVIAGVNIVELDPRDNSVGYGGLPNEDGVVELDASCVHGPTRRMGAVGALQGVRTPSRVARLVMEQTDHMMLVGAGRACASPRPWVHRRRSAHRGIAHRLAGVEAVATGPQGPYQLGTGAGRTAGEREQPAQGEVLKE